MPPFSLASLVSRALAILLFLSATSRAQQEYAWSEFTGSRLTVTMDQWADNGVHYRISKMETSMAQWAEFLNAKVKSDPQGIFFPWGPQFPYDFGITRSGPDGSYLYTVNANYAYRPIFGLRKSDVMRYINWLHNGKGTGDMETGVYDMSQASPTRAAGARYFLPTYLEWMTAAYGDPTGHYIDGPRLFWEYPNSSDTAPDERTNFNRPSITSGQWYNDVNHHPQVVTPGGLINAAGNVAEWIEQAPPAGQPNMAYAMGGDVTSSLAALGFTSASQAFASTRDRYLKAAETRQYAAGIRLAGIVPPAINGNLEKVISLFPNTTAALSTTGLARGTALTYQWYVGEPGDVSQPIPGATSATYTPPNFTANKVFWRRISNGVGTADSMAVRVRLVVPYPGQIEDNIVTNLTADMDTTTAIGEVREVVASGQTFVVWVKGGRLYSVPFNGGTRVDLTSGIADPALPTYSPVTSLSITPQDSRVRRLWTVHGDHAYFYTGGTLYKVPVAGGTPTPLATSLSGVNYFRISPDGAFIYYIHSFGLHRVPVAGGSPQVLVPSTAFSVYNFVVSPNGSRVVFQANPVGAQSYNGGIYSLPAAGGTPIRLNNPNALPGNASRQFIFLLIDPSSSRVVYDGYDDVSNRYHLYSAPIATAGGRVVLENRNSSATGSAMISPDGTRVAYRANVPVADGGNGSNSSLFSVPITGGTKVLHNVSTDFTWVSGDGISFSENSQNIFAHATLNPTRSVQLFGFVLASPVPVLWSSTSASSKILSASTTLTTTFDEDGRLLPANAGITYIRGTNGIGRKDFFTVAMDGTNARKLDNTILSEGFIRGNSYNRLYEISTDSSRMVFAKEGDRVNQTDLYSSLLGNGTIRRLSPHVMTHNFLIRSFGSIGNGDSAWFVGNLNISTRDDLFISRRPEPIPAVFASQPSSATINQGQGVTLEVTAEGTGPITYQWYSGDSGDVSQPISGATATSYATGPLTGISHRFWVRATNPVGTTNSATALITLNQPPSITAHPQGSTILEGDSTVLNVTANGSGTLSYQWYSGNSGVTTTPVGTNAASFTTGPATTTSNRFWVRVNSPYGSADSQTAVLALTPRTPVFTSVSTGNATAGELFSVRVAATLGPNTYTSGNLPSWLKLDPQTGWLTGTPLSGGNLTIDLTATNAYRSAQSTITITIVPPKPVITSPLVFQGKQNEPLTYATIATQSPLSYTSAGLPTGLTQHRITGVISGTPTQYGIFTVTLRATNGGGTGLATLILDIAAPIPPPVVLSPASAAGYVNAAFSTAFSASNSPTSFALQGAPAWLTINAAGVLSGTPPVAGIFPFKVAASNQSGMGAYKDVQLQIEPNPQAPVITSMTQAQGRVSQPFAFTVTTNVPATSISRTGNLPPGVTFQSGTGLLSGTPTAAGTYTSTFTASNSFGPGKPVSLKIIVDRPLQVPVITGYASYRAEVGVAFSQTIPANFSPIGFTFTGLPAWLTQSGTSGNISGTPSVPGTFEFTVHATNGDGDGPEQKLIVVVGYSPDAPVISGTGPLSLYQGMPYSTRILTYSSFTAMTATGLPEGLTLDSASGTIGGTPLAVGDYQVTLQASRGTLVGPPKTLGFRVVPKPGAPEIIGSLQEYAVGLESYFYQIQAKSDFPVLGWAVSGLPDGLYFNTANRSISGAPRQLGTFSVKMQAWSQFGAGKVAVMTLNVRPGNLVPRIVSPASTQIHWGDSLLYDISATNAPIVAWSATGLPEGLVLDAITGKITGKISTPGTYKIQVAATNINGTGLPQEVTILAHPPNTSPALLLPSQINFNIFSGFTYDLIIAGVPKPWPAGTKVTSSLLPPWITLNENTGVLTAYSAVNLIGSTRVTFQATVNGVQGKPASASFFTSFYHYNPLDFPGQDPNSFWAVTGPMQLSAVANQPLSFTAQASSPGLQWDMLLGDWTVANGISNEFTIPPDLWRERPGIMKYSLRTTFLDRGVTLHDRPLRIDPAPGAPTITSGDYLLARVGQAMSEAITSTGSSVSYEIEFDGNAPAGVTFNAATGAITGTPVIPGTYQFLVRAKNGIGWSLPKSMTLAVLPSSGGANLQAKQGGFTRGLKLTIPAQVGVPFTLLPAFSGNPNYFVMQDLPPGLSYNSSTGEISGVPEKPGKFVIRIRPFSAMAVGEEILHTLHVSPAAGTPVMEDLVIQGTAGTALEKSMTATLNPAGYNFSEIPDFILADATTGMITGNPRVPGKFHFTVSAINVQGEGRAAKVTVNIAPAAGTPVLAAASPVPSLQVGVPVSIQLTSAPVADFYDGGSLPYGLKLDAVTGILSGTPLVPGTSEVGVWGVNTNGQGADFMLHLEISGTAGTPVVTNPPAMHVLDGEPLTLQILTTPAAERFSLSPIPDGMEFDPVTGNLSGTPVVGTWTFVVYGTNNIGQGTPKTITLGVHGTPAARWQAQAFGADSADLTISGWNANPSGDGVKNLMKYALGLDPMVSSPALALTGKRELINGQTYLVFTIPRNPEATDVNFIPEISSSLAAPAWASGEANLIIMENTPAMLKVRDALPVTANGKRFVRLKVEMPEAGLTGG